MTAPGYVPPPAAGWWPKSGLKVFPSAGQLALTGYPPTLQQVLRPGGASLTLTRYAPTLTIAPGPVTYQGSAAVAGTSVTLPTHAVGDIIILFAYRDGSNTTPTKPTAGGTVPAWVDIDNPTGASSNSARTAYFVATATNHTSGTWTNATGMGAIVLRYQGASPIGQHGVSSSTDTAFGMYPAITKLNIGDGTSTVVLFSGHTAVTAWSTPTSYVAQRAAANTELVVDTKLVNTAGPGPLEYAREHTHSGPGGFVTATVEIVNRTPTSNISFVSSNAVDSTNTMTLPTHQAGDYIVMFAFRDGTALEPTLPAGWTKLQGGAGTSGAGSVLAYKVAASSSETAGTWTNATWLICAVYRGVSGIGTSNRKQIDSDSIFYWGFDNLQQPNGSSWVALFGCTRDTSGSIATNAVTTSNGEFARRAYLEAQSDGGVWDGPCGALPGGSAGYALTANYGGASTQMECSWVELKST